MFQTGRRQLSCQRGVSATDTGTDTDTGTGADTDTDTVTESETETGTLASRGARPARRIPGKSAEALQQA